MTRSATAMPGVRSSSSSTRPGSIAIRAAWRYSSFRCALAVAVAAAARSNARTTPRLLAGDLRAIVVRRIPIDRVNVVDVALRCVLDDDRRSLDAEVGGGAVLGWPAPREVRLREAGANLVHPRPG